MVENIKIKTMLNEEDNKTYICIMIPMDDIAKRISGRYNILEFITMIKKFISSVSG
jgi:hypothetical protein